jgi:DnaJ-domain-containing protein 1
MNLPKRIRNIAITQINAIKDRLDRVDAEAEEMTQQKRYERDARAELDDPFDIRVPLRTPEEIAGGKIDVASRRVERQTPAARVQEPQARPAPATLADINPLAHHYRVLGVEEGADFETVQAAYSKLAARSAPDRFPEGSDERKTAEEIRKRVDASFDALRDSLDSTAGRFDKLEF